MPKQKGPQGGTMMTADAALKELRAFGMKYPGVHYKSRIYGPRLPNFDMILECAVNGMGLAVVPELHVRDELASGTLRLAFDRLQTSGEGFYLCFPQVRMSSTNVRIFRDWFATEFGRRRQFLPPACAAGQR